MKAEKTGEAYGSKLFLTEARRRREHKRMISMVRHFKNSVSFGKASDYSSFFLLRVLRETSCLCEKLSEIYFFEKGNLKSPGVYRGFCCIQSDLIS